MGDIILDLAVSLDSLIEGPNGEYDWCIMEPEMDFSGFLNSIDAVFYGRKSYEQFGSQVPDTFSELERETYEVVNGKKKYVFSDTLSTENCPDTVIRSRDLLRDVAAVKQQTQKNIWLFGGASLVTTFINHNLIDEYRLSVHPIVLGAGKPLFQGIEQRVQLKLTGSKTFPSGVIQLYYRRG
ncbi:MAG TPA: dihydrofolate reductase family protein [Bacteroidia bacterium]|nr:dihydrofolate reductase family protein [Bacteroidia bacterium]